MSDCYRKEGDGMISWINFDFVHLNYYDVFHILLTAGRNELPLISLCVSTSARTGLLLEYNPSCGWTQSVVSLMKLNMKSLDRQMNQQQLL